MAKTLWKPDYDTDKAIDEFLAGYYGPAAGPIRKYIDLIHKQVADHADWHANIWSPPTAPYLRHAVIATSEKLFDQAEAAVKADAALLRRVRIARMPIQYVRIMTAKKADVSGLIDAFEATARKAKLRMVREHYARGNLDTWLKSVREANDKRKAKAKKPADKKKP